MRRWRWRRIGSELKVSLASAIPRVLFLPGDPGRKYLLNGVIDLAFLLEVSKAPLECRQTADDDRAVLLVMTGDLVADEATMTGHGTRTHFLSVL